MTIEYKKTYTDTEEHILFGAMFHWYKPTIIVGGEELPSWETPEQFLIGQIDSIVAEYMTRPIKAYMKSQADSMAEEAAKVVLQNLS
jgi:hypothetical protein